jgi:AraC-like DNA-binding protein
MITNCTKKNQHDFFLNPVDNYEKKYLNQVINLIELKIDDDRFNFEQFASEMANSKSTLYRKMKLLTGQTPMEFIRSIRLNHAVNMLLDSNNCDITEIAYTVGYNNPKYFSRCFKNKFGLSPTEYKKKMNIPS